MAGGMRIARAAGAAALSTLVALTLHVLAGGHTPIAAGVLVPLAVAFAVGVQLSGKPLGRWRLAVTVAVGQLAFHAAFSFGWGAASAPAVRAHHGEIALGTLAPASHAGAMPLAHLAAALVTYAGIRRADTLVGTLTRLASTVAGALTARLALGAPAPVPSRPSTPVAAALRAALGRLTPHAPATRGPPRIA